MNIPLGDTEAVKWIDGSNTYDLEKLVLNGTTIWELALDITGTAAYSPISRTISMDVTLGDLDSWSWRAQKFGGGGDTGENAVSGVPYAESSEFGVSDDGTWTVTFKGFLNGTLRSTDTASVVVATPFVEITSVEELTPAAPPTLAVGSMIGVVVSIDHQDRNSDEDSDCYTRAVFFQDFDTLSIGSKTSGTLPYLNHPTAYWYYSSSSVWDGVGEVGDCIGDNNANLEHTATMDGVTYKIRYRQILNASVPSGLSLDVSDSQVNQVTSSTSDQYHSFLSPSYMQAFWKAGDSRNHSYIEAYIYSVS